MEPQLGQQDGWQWLARTVGRALGDVFGPPVQQPLRPEEVRAESQQGGTMALALLILIPLFIIALGVLGLRQEERAKRLKRMERLALRELRKLEKEEKRKSRG